VAFRIDSRFPSNRPATADSGILSVLAMLLQQFVDHVGGLVQRAGLGVVVIEVNSHK
jgi:hypothetical protein